MYELRLFSLTSPEGAQKIGNPDVNLGRESDLQVREDSALVTRVFPIVRRGLVTATRRALSRFTPLSGAEAVCQFRGAGGGGYDPGSLWAKWSKCRRREEGAARCPGIGAGCET